MQRPRLRDNTAHRFYELYPIGDIPSEVILKIGKWIIYTYSVGKSDINGEDWGDIFAKSIDGDHLNSPIGLADVVLDGMAWSVKSVKHKQPHSAPTARVISGRCSPDFSYGITDPHKDIQQTGRAVLGIWNERINMAKDKFEPLRSSLLIRNPNALEFTLFEHELHRFNTNDYLWTVNKNGNLEGKNKENGKHYFTWQPHGAQFTIIYDIPRSAKKFILKRPPVLDFQATLNQMNFDNTWITLVD